MFQHRHTPQGGLFEKPRRQATNDHFVPKKRYIKIENKKSKKKKLKLYIPCLSWPYINIDHASNSLGLSVWWWQYSSSIFLCHSMYAFKLLRVIAFLLFSFFSYFQPSYIYTYLHIFFFKCILIKTNDKTQKTKPKTTHCVALCVCATVKVAISRNINTVFNVSKKKRVKIQKKNSINKKTHNCKSF